MGLVKFTLKSLEYSGEINVSSLIHSQNFDRLESRTSTKLTGQNVMVAKRIGTQHIRTKTVGYVRNQPRKISATARISYKNVSPGTHHRKTLTC
jgi:hypothetical protein